MRYLYLFIFLVLLAKATAATYYVRKDGSDSNTGLADNAGGAFLTVQKGADTATAGSTINVRTGTYAEDVRTTSNAGSSGSPIIFDGGNVATIGSFSIENPYIRLNNFTLKGDAATYGMNWQNSAIYFSRTAHFFVVSNNTFDCNYDVRLVRVLKWQAPATFPWSEAASGGLIISNTIKSIVGEVVYKMYGFTNRILFNTHLNADNTDWLHLQGGTNYIIGNTWSNIFYSGTNANHADIIQIFGDAGGTSQASMGHLYESNLVIKADEVSQLGNLTDDSIANVSDLMVRNNIFIGVAAKIGIAMSNVWFYNNTFINCATNTNNGGHLLLWTDAGSIGKGNGGRCYNNVFLNCGPLDSTNNGWYQFNNTLTNVSADYNFVSKLGYQMGKNQIPPKAVGEPGWDTGGDWYEVHGINGGNPLLASESGFNCRPLAGSPLLNAGTNLLSLFTTDIEGTTRDSTPTIGAYENTGTPPVTITAGFGKLKGIRLSP